jgi:hypothetical protein
VATSHIDKLIKNKKTSLRGEIHGQNIDGPKQKLKNGV